MNNQRVKFPLLGVTEPASISMVFTVVDLIQGPGRHFAQERIRVEKLGNKIQLEVDNVQNAYLEDYTRLRPAVRLCKIAVDQKLQYPFGIQFHPGIEIFQATNTLGISKIIQQWYNP